MTIGEIFWREWAEALAIVLLLIGFVVAITIPNAFLKYLIILLLGLMVGRFIYEKKGKQPLFPILLVIFGLFVGFMLGAYGADRKGLAILFFLGAIIGYYIHKKGYIKI